MTKNYTTTLLLLLGIGTVNLIYAQNVGIGTSTPTAKLHIVDNSAITSKLRVETDNSPTIASISISNTSLGGGISMGFVNNLNTYGDPGETYIYSSVNMEGLNIINQNNSGNGHIAFYTSGNHTSTSTLFLSDNDRMGIGIEAPTEKFHLVGNARISSLSGTGNRLVQANATGVLSSIADGTSGQVLTTDGVGNISWGNGIASAWQLLGNAGTNPNTNFIGTTDNQDLVFRTNSIENMRINTNGNIAIGSTSNAARMYLDLPTTDATTNYGLYSSHSGSVNGLKYGFYNSVSANGTGGRYGIYNVIDMNTGSNASGTGVYTELETYGTGDHIVSQNYLNILGTAISTVNYASFNQIEVATPTNTSALYGEYTDVAASRGASYGEYKVMNSNSAYNSTMYGDYNRMLGTGNGVSYAQYNDIENTGTGTKYGVYNNFDDVGGTKYGVYNTFPNGTGTGTIYGVYNNIQNDANATKYGTRNYIGGGNGALRGSYNQVYPAATNTSTIYGVYGIVGSAGTGIHYGGYFNAYGANNRAVYGTNNHASGWAGYFQGNGYFSGNVGIGTNAPTEKLQVNADRALILNGSDAMYCSQNTSSGYGFELIGSYPGWGVSVQRAIVLGGYNQNNTNGQGYDAANRVYCGGGSTATLPIYATSHITTSSKEYKKNITKLEYGLAEVLKINPVSYQYTFEKSGLYKVGFIAEEVSEVIPELVAHHDKDGNDSTRENGKAVGMDYSQMTAVLVNAVKEQQVEMNKLKKELKEMQEKYEELLAK